MCRGGGEKGGVTEGVKEEKEGRREMGGKGDRRREREENEKMREDHIEKQ